MAVIVEVPDEVLVLWEREYHKERSTWRMHLQFSEWIIERKSGGRELKWDEYTPLALQLLWIVCEDDTDAVEFKLRWL